MIVCSQTCFLNDLTQLYPREVLLKAHYYIADLTGSAGIPRSNPNNIENKILYGDQTRLRYDQYGNPVEDTQNANSEDGIKIGNPTYICESASMYHITYTGGALNPTSLRIRGKVGPETRPLTPEERFYNELRSPDCSIEIYRDLFKSKPEGNGLQILIWYSDELCTKFGWIVNEYLANCFGADIIFIDAIYRTRISKHAKKQYIGNKQFGMQFVQWVRDQELLKNLEDDITNVGIRESTQNIRNRIAAQNWQSLIHTYNLLWPNDPLPQGNYSEEQLKEIITHKILQNREPSPLDKLDNLYTMNAGNAFFQMANDYDNEI
jgi:hypothetical protein